MTDLVRGAAQRDLAAINDIYNHAVATSTATFDVTPWDETRRAEWLGEHDAAHPVLVAERQGVVVAWGSLSSVSDRGAWDRTVEISTYVAEGQAGTGLGTAIGRHLLERAAALGHHVVISRICGENEASVGLAQRLGFECVGVMHEVGCKFGRWLDVVVMERVL